MDQKSEYLSLCDFNFHSFVLMHPTTLWKCKNKLLEYPFNLDITCWNTYFSEKLKKDARRGSSCSCVSLIPLSSPLMWVSGSLSAAVPTSSPSCRTFFFPPSGWSSSLSALQSPGTSDVLLLWTDSCIGGVGEPLNRGEIGYRDQWIIDFIVSQA